MPHLFDISNTATIVRRSCDEWVYNICFSVTIKFVITHGFYGVGSLKCHLFCEVKKSRFFSSSCLYQCSFNRCDCTCPLGIKTNAPMPVSMWVKKQTELQVVLELCQSHCQPVFELMVTVFPDHFVIWSSKLKKQQHFLTIFPCCGTVFIKHLFILGYNLILIKWWGGKGEIPQMTPLQHYQQVNPLVCLDSVCHNELYDCWQHSSKRCKSDSHTWLDIHLRGCYCFSTWIFNLRGRIRY